MSCTLTVKLPLAVFPWLSVAEQFTVVVVIEKVEPDAGEQVTETEPSTMSVAVAEKVTVAPDGPVASTVIFAGTVTVGGVVSRTVTVKDALPVLPAASVAEQFTVVVPNGNVLPEGGTQVGVIAPSTMSEALAEKLTTAPDEPVASTVIFEGTVTVGGVVSCTVIVKEALPVLL